MIFVELVLRWLHILSAIALMGGTIFMRFGVHPSLATLPADCRESFKAAVRSHWARWVMATSGLLLLSGLINFVSYASKGVVKAMPYHPIMMVKILLALAIFFIASLLVGRSAGAERFREKAVFWLNVNLVLATLVVCIGGFLRTLHHEPRQGDDSPLPAPAARLEIEPAAGA